MASTLLICSPNFYETSDSHASGYTVFNAEAGALRLSYAAIFEETRYTLALLKRHIYS